MERTFRRAGLALRMSEGFHPKPRMNFPSALALGIEGADEIMELELEEPRPADALLADLRTHAPPGMQFRSAELLPPGAPKAAVCRACFAMPIPPERRESLKQRIDQFLAERSHCVVRPDRDRSVDIRPLVESLGLVDGQLRMSLQVRPGGSARPREVLEALHVADVEQNGCYLTRTAVELQQA